MFTEEVFPNLPARDTALGGQARPDEQPILHTQKSRSETVRESLQYNQSYQHHTLAGHPSKGRRI